MPELPPWIKPAETTEPFLRSITIGSSIAERQNAAEQAALELAQRREQQQAVLALQREQQAQAMAMKEAELAQRDREAALQWQWHMQANAARQAQDKEEAARRAAEAEERKRQFGEMMKFREKQLGALTADREKRQIISDSLALRNQLDKTTVDLRMKTNALQNMSLSATDAEKQTLIDEINLLRDQASRIQNQLAEMGVPVDVSTKGRFELKPVVSPINDERGLLAKYWPNILGGTPKPAVAITNMVPTFVPAMGEVPPPAMPAPGAPAGLPTPPSMVNPTYQAAPIPPTNATPRYRYDLNTGEYKQVR